MSCEFNPLLVPLKVKITEKGIKHLKSNLMFWIKKPQFEKVIGKWVAMSEEKQQQFLRKSLGNEQEMAKVWFPLVLIIGLAVIPQECF